MIELRWASRVTNVRAGPRKVLQYRVKQKLIDSDDYQFWDWGPWEDVPTVLIPRSRSGAASGSPK